MIREDGRDYIPITSPGAIEQFLTGSLYQDFINEINLRIEDFRDLLESPEKVLTDDGLSTEAIRGGLKCAREMMSIFNDLLNNSVTANEIANDDN